MEKYTQLDVKLNKILIGVYLAGKEWSPLPMDIIVDTAIAQIKQLFPSNKAINPTPDSGPVEQSSNEDI